MIGFATRLDPLPTTFDHPSRILRREGRCVNRHVVVLLNVLEGVERSPKFAFASCLALNVRYALASRA